MATTTGYQTPREAMRDFCKWCVHGSWAEIKACMADTCVLHQVRGGKTIRGVSPLKTIRAKCLSCGEGTPSDVSECAHSDCSLFPFRFGKHPGRKGHAPKHGFTKKTQQETACVDTLPQNTPIDSLAGALPLEMVCEESREAAEKAMEATE